MKKFIVEYMNIIGYAIAGLIFAYGSFYLFINLYHAKELSRQIDINLLENDAYMAISEKMSQVKSNISEFNAANYHGSAPVHNYLSIQGRIEICTRQFENETFLGLKNKKTITISDVEKLRRAYQNQVLSTCLIEQLYDIVNSESIENYQIPSFKQIAPYVELNIRNLLVSYTYVTADILNNHIYYFTTDHTYVNLFGKQRLAYSELITAYNRAADLIVQLSEWFKEEVK